MGPGVGVVMIDDRGRERKIERRWRAEMSDEVV